MIKMKSFSLSKKSENLFKKNYSWKMLMVLDNGDGDEILKSTLGCDVEDFLF